MAGVLMTQLLPFFDSALMAAFEAFERTAYSLYRPSLPVAAC